MGRPKTVPTFSDTLAEVSERAGWALTEWSPAELLAGLQDVADVAPLDLARAAWGQRRADPGAALRMRRTRARRAAGRVLLRVETDEADLITALYQAHLLDPMTDHTREDIERAVEQLLRLLAR